MKREGAAKPQLRRKPQQARASARRGRFLEVAAQLIAQSGYDAVTMTAIAENAQASIGTLYDYFPDKPALALALLARYTEEADAHWKALLTPARLRSKAVLADVFIEGILDFVRQRPAYLALLDAPIAYTRTKSARRPLRRTIARAFKRLHPEMPAKQAVLVAEIIVTLIKSFLAVYRRAAARDRAQVEAEFRRLLRLYLVDQFKATPIRKH